MAFSIQRRWSGKGLAALDHLVRHPALTRRLLAQAYNERIVSRGRIPSVEIGQLVARPEEVRLVAFVPEPGNVSVLELLCLCLLVRALRPRQVLELGTFNGNTALQLAANLDPDARLTTVDLPLDGAPVAGPNAHDAVLIRAATRERPRYLGSSHGTKVTQVYGNTLALDFATLCPRPPDFIFIDAGHSDECVRNDSRKALAALAPVGTIVWHDYTQDWPDVFAYLTELSGSVALEHVAGTNLVLHRRRGA